MIGICTPQIWYGSVHLSREKCWLHLLNYFTELQYETSNVLNDMQSCKLTKCRTKHCCSTAWLDV